MKLFSLLLAAAVSLCGQTLVNGSRTIQGTINYCVDAGGTDAYACNLAPAPTAYVSGARYQFEANTANAGAATLNLNSLGAIAIKKPAGGVATDLADNDIRAGQIVTVVYDGTNMQMASQLGNAGGGGGGGGTLDTTTNPTLIWQTIFGGTGWQPAGGANQGACHRVSLGHGLISTRVTFRVTTASGTCAGTCGFGAALYNSSGTGVGYTEIGYSGHASAVRDINTLGAKTLSWLSGSAVSGGTLTVVPGSYYLCVSTDSTVLQMAAVGSAYWMEEDNELIPDSHGGKSGFSTGAGASLVLPATKTGTFTYSWADMTPVMFWY